MNLDPALAVCALHRVRALLEAGDTFICCMLDTVGKDNPHLRRTCRTLRDYVHRELFDLPSFSHWLSIEGYPDLGRRYRADCLVDIPAALRKLNAAMDMCRLAWIDRMLYELKTKGTLP